MRAAGLRTLRPRGVVTQPQPQPDGDTASRGASVGGEPLVSAKLSCRLSLIGPRVSDTPHASEQKIRWITLKTPSDPAQPPSNSKTAPFQRCAASFWFVRSSIDAARRSGCPKAFKALTALFQTHFALLTRSLHSQHVAAPSP